MLPPCYYNSFVVIATSILLSSCLLLLLFTYESCQQRFMRGNNLEGGNHDAFLATSGTIFSQATHQFSPSQKSMSIFGWICIKNQRAVHLPSFKQLFYPVLHERIQLLSYPLRAKKGRKYYPFLQKCGKWNFIHLKCDNEQQVLLKVLPPLCLVLPLFPCQL